MFAKYLETKSVAFYFNCYFAKFKSYPVSLLLLYQKRYLKWHSKFSMHQRQTFGIQFNYFYRLY